MMSGLNVLHLRSMMGRLNVMLRLGCVVDSGSMNIMTSMRIVVILDN